jgi:DNA-binding NtrC family response regulator
MTAAHILVVDDEADIRGLVSEILSEEGYEVEVAADAAQARTLRARREPDLVLLDIWMPQVDGITLLREWSATITEGCPVVMMSGHGTVETAVEATRLGAFDFVEKPLSLATLLRTVERALESGRERLVMSRRVSVTMTAPAGKSRAMQQARADLARAASGLDPVLLVGEYGTGREAFARYLHGQGPRADRPFVMMVASALRDTDAEAVLFGRADGEGGAGLIEQAGQGTLFVSELGDLPAAAQRLLLGVLESGHWSRLGEPQQHPLEARLVAAVQPDVEHPAAAGASVSPVRRDLFARMGGVVVRVPPLREYAEDVPDLLRQTVDRLVDSEGLEFRRFGVAAQNRLRNYPWPGNVQELHGMVRRVLMRGGSEEVSLEETEREIAQSVPPSEMLVKQDLLSLGLREAREQFERAYLQQQLLLCQGKVGQLAKRVGMERTHLYRKLRSLGIDFRGVPEETEV